MAGEILAVQSDPFVAHTHHAIELAVRLPAVDLGKTGPIMNCSRNFDKILRSLNACNLTATPEVTTYVTSNHS